MDRATEHELIRKATAGDRDAAAACIQAHQASLYAYLLRMSGRPEVAEDIAQEAFVRVLTNLHRFDYRFRFSTWLFTIAKRLYVNARQKHAPIFNTDAVSGQRDRDNARADEWGGCPVGHAEVEETDAYLKDDLQDALMELGEDQREIVVLFHQLDWPIAIIAQHMDMPEGTIKSHLHRSRRKMKAFMQTDRKRADRLREAFV